MTLETEKPRNPFAHLTGNVLNPQLSAARAADDDERKDDDEKDEDKKSKKAKNEEDERDDDKDDKPSAEKEKDEDEKEDAKRKAKKKSKAKAADDDERKDDDEKDDGEKDDKKSRALGATRERARIRAIFTSDAGMRHLKSAWKLAMDTDFSADQAIVMLEMMDDEPKPQKDALRERMGSVKQPDIGATGDPTSGPTLAEQIILAGKKRRGEI